MHCKEGWDDESFNSLPVSDFDQSIYFYRINIIVGKSLTNGLPFLPSFRLFAALCFGRHPSP